MSVTIDTTNLTPLEQAAINYAANSQNEAGVTPQAFLEAFVARAISAWADEHVTASLPMLKPLAEGYLNLNEEQQEEVRRLLGAEDPAPEQRGGESLRPSDVSSEQIKR